MDKQKALRIIGIISGITLVVAGVRKVHSMTFGKRASKKTDKHWKDVKDAVPAAAKDFLPNAS